MSKKDSKDETRDAPPPGRVEGYVLWDVASPPATVVSKEDGEAWLERHIQNSGEPAADVRLVKIKEEK